MNSLPPPIEHLRVFEDRVQGALGSEFEGSPLLKVLHFAPFKGCIVLDRNGSKIELEKLSSIVENLPITWQKDIQIRAYWVGLSKTGNDFLADPTRSGPSCVQLAEAFVEGLLGSKVWSVLKHLVDEA
jgi:hypothetical protein